MQKGSFMYLFGRINQLGDIWPFGVTVWVPVQEKVGYTWAYAQIIQHKHTHKAVTGRVEAKKLLSRRRQSNTRLGLR